MQSHKELLPKGGINISHLLPSTYKEGDLGTGDFQEWFWLSK
jgi:hypothetical protein